MLAADEEESAVLNADEQKNNLYRSERVGNTPAPKGCPRCERLERRLESLELERGELSRENRHLWGQNSALREELAVLRERQSRQGCISIIPGGLAS